MELVLKLDKDHLLSSTVGALSGFSEMGVRCGVLKQMLTIIYKGEQVQTAIERDRTRPCGA